jgi:hypothetical protein
VLEYFRLLLATLRALLLPRLDLAAENLLLRQQLAILQRSVKRPRLRPVDRFVWAVAARHFHGWKDTLAIVKPWDAAPRYLLRDRDGVYGAAFRRRVKGMGIREVLIAPRSPWQNPFAERVIGSIRRELLDHVIVLGERHLRRLLREYAGYYNGCRTHLSLDKDAPESRGTVGPDEGEVVAFPKLGGLHHLYVRRAA